MSMYVCIVVPGSVSDVHIVSLTSKSVILSWSSLDCRQRNGPTVGYFCELVRQSVHSYQTTHSAETSHVVETSHRDRLVIHHRVVNDTQLQLSRLEPFTHYVFTVSFRNSDFDGPKTFVNFTTDEDGAYHRDLVIVTQHNAVII